MNHFHELRLYDRFLLGIHVAHIQATDRQVRHHIQWSTPFDMGDVDSETFEPTVKRIELRNEVRHGCNGVTAKVKLTAGMSGAAAHHDGKAARSLALTDQ